MPWTPAEAHKHTHLADTPRRQRMFADIANSELQRHGDDGEAIRIASGVVKRDHEKPKSNGLDPKQTDHWSGR
jgi:hypothetical protein